MKLYREDRVDIFNDTMKCVLQGYYINKKGEKRDLSLTSFADNYTGNSNKDKFKGALLYNFTVNTSHIDKYHNEANFYVMNMDCLYAAEMFVKDGFKTMVINNASYKRPGGGVITGSAAQEENLCRRTNLAAGLFRYDEASSKRFGIPFIHQGYPLQIDNDVLISRDVKVFRASEDRMYEMLDDTFNVDILTISAFKHPNLSEDLKYLDDYERNVMKNKIKQMFEFGKFNGDDTIVLGAFGCGAYANPPVEVAKIFKEVIDENDYVHYFKNIVFAIFDDGNAHKWHNPNGNFEPFKKMFG